MGQTDDSDIAAALLANAKSTPVVDALLAAGAGRSQNMGNDNRFESIPPASTSTVHTAGYSAATLKVLARTATDPDVLDWLAHRPQKSVRRQAAMNRHLPYGAVRYLWRAAVKHDDLTTLRVLAGVIPIDLLSNLRCETPTDRLSDADVTFRRLHFGPEMESPDMFQRFTSAHFSRQAAAAARVGRGEVPGDLDALIGAVPTSNLGKFFAIFLVRMEGHPLEDRVVEAAAAAMPHGSGVDAERVAEQFANRHLTSSAVSSLLDWGDARMARAVLSAMEIEGADLLPEHVDMLVGRALEVWTIGAYNFVDPVLCGIPELLTEVHLASLATLDGPYGDSAVERVLETPGVALTDSSLGNLLHRASPQLTERWLTSKLLNVPTATSLVALADRSDLPGGRMMFVRTWTRFNDWVLRPLAVSPPEMRHLLNICGSETVAASAKNLLCAEYVAYRLDERFGDDQDAWVAAVRLSSVENVETVDDWLGLVAAVL